MNLFPENKETYTHEKFSAREAQRLAQFIAFGPVVFQVSRLMVKYGIFQLLHDHKKGLTYDELLAHTHLSRYALKILMEASLSIQTVIIDTETDRFKLTKTGWFLLCDPSVRVNMDFNHDVNYLGLFKLNEALEQGKPAGLSYLGPWPTIYEGLSSLEPQVQQSWFNFDHYYSDTSFKEALHVVFDARHPKTLYDIGGNTGKWAMRCTEYDPDVKVTIVDLPQQLDMMRQNTQHHLGKDRIEGYPINWLDASMELPEGRTVDAIWMSQFLDCFNEEQIYSILTRTVKAMHADSRLYIMETFWDRQKFEPAAFCLTQISVYFTALANGNSKMYHSDDLIALVHKAGLDIEEIHDQLGLGHTILVCRLKP